MHLPGDGGEGHRVAWEMSSTGEGLGTERSSELRRVERSCIGDPRELVLGEKNVTILLGIAGLCGEEFWPWTGGSALRSWLSS